MGEGEGAYSPMNTKVEDAAAAQYKTMRLIVRQGRGSCVIDAYNDVLHAQACLLGDAALGDLPESVRESGRVCDRQSKIHSVRAQTVWNQLSGVACKVHINKMRAKCQQKSEREKKQKKKKEKQRTTLQDKSRRGQLHKLCAPSRHQM